MGQRGAGNGTDDIFTLSIQDADLKTIAMAILAGRGFVVDIKKNIPAVRDQNALQSKLSDYFETGGNVIFLIPPNEGSAFSTACWS